ncbi:MAG: hypothetical protein GY856_22455 [bacterium]|nr:hypothetical protein [bacterium]
MWRLPGEGGPASAEACALAHLELFDYRSALPHDAALSPALSLLADLWQVGLYPQLVHIRDLLLLLLSDQGVALPSGVAEEHGAGEYVTALGQLVEQDAFIRLRNAHLGPTALATAVARLVRQAPAGDKFRPPTGSERAVLAALARPHQPPPADATGLLPPGTGEAWKKALLALDLEELRAIHALGADRISPWGLAAAGLSLDGLPELLRPVLGAVLRLLPMEHAARRSNRRTAGLAGGDGFTEITNRGNLDNLLPTEHAFPADLLQARLLQREALFFGREVSAPLTADTTWVLVDAGPAMTGDPLLLARAVAWAARSVAGPGTEAAFFGPVCGERQVIERPADRWFLLYGDAPPAESNASTTGLWKQLERDLEARPAGGPDVHLLIVSHDLFGVDESGLVLAGLEAIAAQADLRLVLIELPRDPPPPQPGVEDWQALEDLSRIPEWVMSGPSLEPEPLPWQILRDRGVSVTLVPLGMLWDDPA